MTTMVSPGWAAPTAAWIDSPGRTTCASGFAEASPATSITEERASRQAVMRTLMRRIRLSFLHFAPDCLGSVRGLTSVDCSIEVVPFREGTSKGAGIMVPIPFLENVTHVSDNRVL